jgi:hypothetical protein
MAKRKRLSKKQLAVIDDLFGGELDEQAVLKKHRVNRNVYNGWLADELFTSEFDRRIMSAHRQSAALIAKYTPHAAAKLVQLTGSEKVETARKACVDIISLPALLDKRTARPSESQSEQTYPLQKMTEQTASRLLAVLADEKSDGQIRKF